MSQGKAWKVYKQSGDITSMTDADGYIVLPEGVDAVETGELVRVTLLP